MLDNNRGVDDLLVMLAGFCLSAITQSQHNRIDEMGKTSSM